MVYETKIQKLFISGVRDIIYLKVWNCEEDHSGLTVKWINSISDNNILLMEDKHQV